MQENKNFYKAISAKLMDIINNMSSEDVQYLKCGGKTKRLLKKGGKPKIHIKESQKGSFTSYCGGKVTNECIQRGKNSPDPKIRKKATFAANVRKFNH